MIDLQYFKDRISEHPEHGIMSMRLETFKLHELIEAIEEVKMIMEVLKNGSFGSYRDPANWLEKYFEEELGNNGEPIPNPNPEVCEDQVEVERLKNE